MQKDKERKETRNYRSKMMIVSGKCPDIAKDTWEVG